MSLIKYKILIHAVERGSITAAAEEMGYTQSGVSHMLNSLEDELGIKIINRNRNGVQLTSNGTILYPYIKKVVNENQNFAQVVSEITDVLKGKLTIGAFTTITAFYLPEMLSKFLADYPNVEVEIKQGSYPEIEDLILNDEVDCGFISLPTSTSLNVIPVASDRLVVAAGKDYPHHFSDLSSVTIDEIINERLIFIDKASEDYDMQRLFQNRMKDLKPIITTWNSFATMEMVKKNMGICIVPISLVDSFLEDMQFFEFENTFERTLAFAYKDRKNASPITKKFIRLVESSEVWEFAKPLSL